jgi:hypothetical protein
MTIRRFLLAVIFSIAWSPRAGWSAEAERPISRFTSTPARPLRSDDLEIAVAVPRLDDIEGDMVRRKLDLGERGDLAAFKDALGQLSRLAERQHDYAESHPERVLPFRHDLASSGKRHALQEMMALVDRLLHGGAAGAARDATMFQLLELHHAVDNSLRYPLKKNYQVVPDIVPMLLLKARSHRVIERSRATGPSPAVSEADPPPSSFWSPAADIASRNLYAGFGRTALPTYEGVCTYVKAKTGWGAHPGFEISCRGTRLEFKLGDEIYGGPFNTRIFDALGYRTFPIDRMPALELAYDRRVLSEYNSRRRLAMYARALFIPIGKHVVTRIEDPFDRIAAAVTTDGRRLTAAELKRGLLKDATLVKGRPRPETVAANYDADFERQIAYLVWEPGTVAHEGDSIRTIGAWDYDQLDHAARREVRGVFVLSAWLDQFNMRWENTRLAYAREGDARELRHVFSDVGSGLADAHQALKADNSDIEGMPWTVTESAADGKVKFSGFAVNVMNEAFAQTSWEDARWMLRRMARLTERQILQALLATSMTASEVRLALEKLLCKRQKMVADFGLSSELPDIARRRIDRELEFDPAKPDDLRAVTLSLPDGATIVPEPGDWVIQKGHLVRRVVAPPPRVVEDVACRRPDSSASWACSQRGSSSTSRWP